MNRSAPATVVGRGPAELAHHQAVADRLVLAVLLGGVFVVSIDVAIVNVAIPAIAADLAASPGQLQLVVSAYSLAYAALLITGARLGQRLGYRQLFSTGLAGFTVASLLCGVAPGPVLLITGRALQGVAAAAMTPQVVTIIQLRFDGSLRTRALAWWASTIAAGFVVGQVLGGLLVGADVAGLGWRAVFLVNVPVGLTMWALGRRVLTDVGARQPTELDPLGAVLVTGAVIGVVVPLLFGARRGWPWWSWVVLADAAVLAALAVWHMRRRRDAGRRALIDPALFANGPVGAGLAALAALMTAYGGFLYVTTLHLQRTLGVSPLRSGLTLAPYAAAFAVTSLAFAKVGPGRRRHVAMGGALARATGYLAAGVAARTGEWRTWIMVDLFALAGLGFGAAYSTTVGLVTSAVPAARAQDASGVLTTTIQISFVLGVATVGTAYVGRQTTPVAGGPYLTTGLATAGLALLAVAAIGLSPRRATPPTRRPPGS